MKELSMISLPGVVDSLHGLVGDAGAEEDDVDAAGVVAGGELDAEALAIAHHDVVEHVLEVVDDQLPRLPFSLIAPGGTTRSRRGDNSRQIVAEHGRHFRHIFVPDVSLNRFPYISL